MDGARASANAGGEQAMRVRADDVYAALSGPVPQDQRVVLLGPSEQPFFCGAHDCDKPTVVATRFETRRRRGHDGWAPVMRRGVCQAHLDALREHCGDRMVTYGATEEAHL